MHIKNLNVGDYVSFLDCGWTTNMFGSEVKVQNRFAGIPLPIIAISTPYLLLKVHDGTVMPVDTREITVTKLNKEYVDMYIKTVEEYQEKNKKVENG